MVYEDKIENLLEKGNDDLGERRYVHNGVGEDGDGVDPVQILLINSLFIIFHLRGQLFYLIHVIFHFSFMFL